MKVYFTAAISDIPADHQDNYKDILKALKELGHDVISDHIIGKTREVLDKQSDKEAKTLYRKMIKWKHQADLVVAEVSYPSFGVGQEISYALHINKPVVALHLKNRQPRLLTVVGEEYLNIVEYSKENLKKILDDYIEYARGTSDTRFNFFISSDIDAFLDWVARKRKTPRAVFLRQLIEEDMQNNASYLRETGKAKKARKSKRA